MSRHSIRFEITRSCGGQGGFHGRVGRVTTPHGSFDTPAFMPVATAAAMKGLTPTQVRATGSQCILNNAFHLLLRPGADRIADIGGVHQFMRWDGPILTDSGGFQAFSMAQINRIDENGATFQSFIDGKLVHLGPESSMAVQQALGADIAMAFDDCPPAGDSIAEIARAARTLQAKDRTLRWLERCIAAHHRNDQALFGIVQGGTDLALRSSSVDATCAFDMAGYAIGGVAVGEGTMAIERVVRHTAPLLPADRPRYLMGVGYPRDIVMAVESGVDMFDCVLPTRNGRNGMAFTREGALRLRNAKHAEDPKPIELDCDCEACAGGFSRAYLRHLFMAGEMLGPTLISLHNIRIFQRLLLDIRRAIEEDTWLQFRRAWPCTNQAQSDTLDLHGVSDD
ncbi:MAG: tRNA guanosine(34) transglycosylase Tgt [Phycisphaerales bacterium]|nr:tRNA guanosine(34) transglycosylase Tgt [Phycisphaerales bacterium]